MPRMGHADMHRSSHRSGHVPPWLHGLTAKHVARALTGTFSALNARTEPWALVMGATACVVLRIGLRLYSANAGDARSTIVERYSTLRLSTDHRPNEPSERQRLLKAGISVAHNRVDGRVAVSRAIGDHAFKAIISHPTVSRYEINPVTKALIIGCDGLWDVVTDAKAAAIVRAAGDPHTASRRLVDEAKSKGSVDNISVLVVDLTPLAKRARSASSGKRKKRK